MRFCKRCNIPVAGETCPACTYFPEEVHGRYCVLCSKITKGRTCPECDSGTVTELPEDMALQLAESQSRERRGTLDKRKVVIGLIMGIGGLGSFTLYMLILYLEWANPVSWPLLLLLPIFPFAFWLRGMTNG